MSQTSATPLRAISDGLESIVQVATAGIVAVKALAYRVTTGVCIGPNLVAVADHALKREDKIPLFTSRGDEVRAKLLGRVPAIDVAILRTDENVFTPLPTADKHSLKPGALAVVLGLTLDVGPSVSLGILGAVGDRRRTWRGGVLDQFIRLDVNLYPSQIGAAVLNVEGQLIGLATPALLRHSAVAVPVETLSRIGDELLKEGRIRHGYLGVGVQPIALPESLRAKVNLDISSGLMIMLVNPESPAEAAGIQLGDILVSLHGNPLSSVEDLQDALEGASVSNTVPAVIVRGGELVQVSVTIAEGPRREKRSETN
jgi:S1-C subfamily serine protease